MLFADSTIAENITAVLITAPLVSPLLLLIWRATKSD